MDKSWPFHSGSPAKKEVNDGNVKRWQNKGTDSTQLRYGSFIPFTSEDGVEMALPAVRLLYEGIAKGPSASHDHLHHLRAWFRAKELSEALNKTGTKTTDQDLENAIIAIFFHDIGMTVSIEESHGRESRKICESFFNDHVAGRPHGLKEVL